jgi:glycosyltransferase involved in cell wall biosynthesis
MLVTLTAIDQTFNLFQQQMKTVFYYTSTYFLDISLEIINVLKEQTDLHVLIEITPQSKNANIINIENLPEGEYLVTPDKVLPEKELSYLETYFAGAKSVHFVIHSHPSGMSFKTLKVVGAVRRYMKKYNPSVVHFEGFTLRTVGLAPYLLRCKKLALTVHDVVLHSGETSWKSKLPQIIFFRLPVKKTFLFYSSFSMQQFDKFAKHSKANNVLLQMKPFSYFSKIAGDKPVAHKNLLFFGRISKYKGVDLLLDAMPAVLDHFPAEELLIAGKGADDSILKHPVLSDKKNNISLLNRYIPNDELTGLIRNAKLIICPYLDATQSGVLMTAFALDKPVIATNVGAFPEHIKNGFNGVLVENVNAKDISTAIISGLKNEYYLQLENNLKISNQSNPWMENIPALQEAYE